MFFVPAKAGRKVIARFKVRLLPDVGHAGPNAVQRALAILLAAAAWRQARSGLDAGIGQQPKGIQRSVVVDHAAVHGGDSGVEVRRCAGQVGGARAIRILKTECLRCATPGTGRYPCDSRQLGEGHLGDERAEVAGVDGLVRVLQREIRGKGPARDIHGASGVERHRRSVIGAVAAKVAEVGQRITGRAQLGKEGVAIPADSGLQRRHDRQIGGIGVSSYVGTATGIYGNGVAHVHARSSQVSAVHERAGGVHLGDESVQPAIQRGLHSVQQREIDRAGDTRHVGVALAVERDPLPRFGI